MIWKLTTGKNEATPRMSEPTHVKDDIYRSTFLWRGKPRSVYFYKRNCAVCGKSVFQFRGNVACAEKKGKPIPRPTCSDKCHYSMQSGAGNSRFNGGMKFKRGAKGGPRLIYAPEHPNAYKKYCYEHRLIMEKHIKRFLRKDEYVHHINCDGSDNTIGNLVVVSQRQHNMAHASIEHCVRVLMLKGVLKFNHKKFYYEVNL